MRLRTGAAAGALVLLLAGCVVAPRGSGPTPYCAQINDSIVLMVQAVPTASLIPCVDNLPRGWTYNGEGAGQDGAQLVFASDRAGPDALNVSLRSDCRLGGAVEVPSDEVGARLYVRMARVEPRVESSRFYVFPGGCVTYQVKASDEIAAQVYNEASLAVGFVSSYQVRRYVRDRYDRDL